MSLIRAASIIVVVVLSCSTGEGWAIPPPEVNPSRYAAPDAGTPPPIPPRDRPTAPSQETDASIPDDLKAGAMNLSLSQLVDAALRINPQTRIAWAKAKAQAAQWAVTRSSYYPSVAGELEGAAGEIPATLGNRSYFNSTVELSYLLLDFGNRRATSEASRQALVAANWNHDQAIQDVLRNVPKAFYTLIGNKALVRADEAALKDAQTSLDAASARKDVGAATIADVLQAESSLEQVQYTLANDRGAVEISRGSLATAVGWPANTPFDVAGEFNRAPTTSMEADVDALIERARKDRPDLNAAIATLRQRTSQVKAARALPYPQLTGTGNALWQISRGGNTASGLYGGLGLSVPLFDGFSMHNQLRKAKAELEQAHETLKATEEQVVTDVWNAHVHFTTALEQLAAAQALLSSASQSYAVSLGQYKAGAADIVQLMNTQSQLASARAQLVSARFAVFISYAELIHAIGAGFDATIPGEDAPPLAVSEELKDETHGPDTP